MRSASFVTPCSQVCPSGAGLTSARIFVPFLLFFVIFVVKPYEAPARTNVSSLCSGGAVLADKVAVALTLQCHALDVGADIACQLLQIIQGEIVRERIIGLGLDIKAVVHTQEAGVEEAFAVVAGELAAGFEQLDLMPQRIGNLHGAAMRPQRLWTMAGPIVQDDEVADALEFHGRQAVIFGHQGRRAIGVREAQQQLVDAGLDQGNAGRFQRFQEAAGQADGDAVAVP